MCGIGGILTSAGAAFPAAAIGVMSSALRHRGPDDCGYLLWDGASAPARLRVADASPTTRLGALHRRLSIIDLAPTGWQPMTSHDGRFDIIFNGEIYNYVELRREFEAAGETFGSTSDTEVLLAAWSRWGEAALDRISGMYAFAVVDWHARRMTLVRDCFGIKPLYYAAWQGGFAFASEVKALLCLPTVSRAVAPAPLFQYLAFGLSDFDHATLFADIRQLPPASLLEIDIEAGAISEPRRYWKLPTVHNNDIDFATAAGRLREMFIDSVRLHLRSDVPVGAALSGGLDSSAIVMAMRQIGGSGIDLHTFTYAADDPEIGEERWADLIGSAAKTTAHKVRIAPHELVTDLDRLIRDQDLPFGSTSIYAQHRVFAAARATGIKVMLDGQGADEMFAGYRPYVSARVVSLLRSGGIREAMMLLRNAMGLPGGGGIARNLLRVLAGLIPGRWWFDAMRRRQAERAALDVSWFAERNALDGTLISEGRSSLREALATTFSHTSLPALLRYEDRNSMAHSIESRVPFLTRSLVDFVFALPEQFLLSSDGSGKTVLRAAMRGLVPDAVLDRRDKIGFETPERGWLSDLDGWVRNVLASEAAHAVPILSVDAVLAEWNAVREGRRPFDWRIWRWLNVIRWSALTQARFV